MPLFGPGNRKKRPQPSLELNSVSSSEEVKRPAFLKLKLLKLWTQRNQMIAKLASKKFLAVIVTAFIVSVGTYFGAAKETLESIALIAASFITGQGIADFGERGRQIVSAFSSRKVWVSIASTVLIAGMDYLGVDPGITKWVVAVVSPYLIGEGIADAGKAFRLPFIKSTI